MNRESVAAPQLFKSNSREYMEGLKSNEEAEKSNKQEYDPAGLGDSHQPSKIEAPVMSFTTISNGFPNLMSPNSGLNNAMDYNQMMQFMSANMGGGIANFNPMMGKSSSMLRF